MVSRHNQRFREVFLNYIICSTGRARSGVLTAYLKQLQYGAPDEFFEVARFNILNKPLVELKPFIESKRVDGIFGMRIVWSHLRRLYEKHGIGMSRFIEEYVPDPKIIFLQRDPIEQAIEVNYDTPEAIPSRIAEIVKCNTAWELFFKQNHITPFRMRSEDLCEYPEISVRKVVYFLNRGISPDIELKNIFHDHLTQHQQKPRLFKQHQTHLLFMQDISNETEKEVELVETPDHPPKRRLISFRNRILEKRGLE